MNVSEYTTTKCAHCGHIALHQNRVEVFCRQQDAEIGTLVIVDATVGGADRPGEKWGESGEPATTILGTDPLDKNPSSRRHGLTVHLWCEGCSKTTLLHVYQHKGMTLVEAVAA